MAPKKTASVRGTTGEAPQGSAALELMTIEQLEIEERRLRVEMLREQVGQQMARKETMARNRRDQERTERHNRAVEKANQELCPHKKGGRGVEGVFAGNDSNYSVIKHTEPWGETYVKCQRCGREVRDPFFMLRKIDPAAVAMVKHEDAAGYSRKMRLYRRWMALPTDNSPSGNAIFNIQREVDIVVDELEDEEDLVEV